MIPNLQQLLLNRLRQQGVDPNDADPFLRDLLKIFASNAGIDSAAANSKLQLLGWNGVTLDFQSLQLALAWIER